jgi:hypothetical protein
LKEAESDEARQVYERQVLKAILDAILNEHYGKITEQLNLDSRQVFVLDNPLIPDEFRYLAPNLENL